MNAFTVTYGTDEIHVVLSRIIVMMFLELNEKEKRGTFSWENLDLAVITNSDYIMEKMLQETELSNISGSYLSDHKKAMNQGIPLDFKKNKIFFGYIRRKMMKRMN